ncbi:MAG: MotA/TolQ/ExbB proton channel family protein [Limnohabitans sp.]|jgi:biopolymer transport protein ExbB|nr:MotA/TolQ/ExbB proton channel family protein [Betaproteobacteria bacterium]
MMLLLHDASLYLLYFALAVAVFLTIERVIFYNHAHGQIQNLLQSLHTKTALPEFKSGGVGAVVATAFANGLRPSASQKMAEDVAEQAFIRVQHKLNQHLWVLDTIVTAAPLLGLLGTILGIFDTFTALAKSGISDPQGVSAGIGTALLATAIGIGTALICLVIYNGFMAWVEKLGDETKLALLEMSNQAA